MCCASRNFLESSCVPLTLRVQLLCYSTISYIQLYLKAPNQTSCYYSSYLRIQDINGKKFWIEGRKADSFCAKSVNLDSEKKMWNPFFCHLFCVAKVVDVSGKYLIWCSKLWCSFLQITLLWLKFVVRLVNKSRYVIMKAAYFS